MIVHGVRLLTEDGLSEPCTKAIRAEGGPEVVDGSGCILSPGWIDLHAHLRDPGDPRKETFATGLRSAAAGGFTHVVAMANTMPVTDTGALVRTQIGRTAGHGVRVSFVGALTYGLEGAVLTDARALEQAGAVALSDDGRHAMARATLESGLAQAAAVGLPVLVHAQYETSQRSVDDETRATREAITALRRAPGARLHVQHVSARAAVQLVREAKAEGLRVTAEATPHHLTLTAADVAALGPNAAVNPPLRSAADRAALLEGLLDGTIDAIATDHAPHDAEAKQEGAFGFHGFETALALVLRLGLPWDVVHRRCVGRPAEILGFADDDDWILVDPRARWVVDPEAFHSLGRNSPVAGWALEGTVQLTVVRGRVVHQAGVPVG